MLRTHAVKSMVLITAAIGLFACSRTPSEAAVSATPAAHVVATSASDLTQPAVVFAPGAAITVAGAEVTLSGFDPCPPGGAAANVCVIARDGQQNIHVVLHARAGTSVEEWASVVETVDAEHSPSHAPFQRLAYRRPDGSLVIPH